MHEKRFQRATTFALVFAMLLSLLPMAVPKAGAASTSTLANAPIPVLTDRGISRKLERKGAQKHGTEKDKKGNATTSVR